MAAALSGGYGFLQFIADALSLPNDLAPVWRVIMQTPTALPWIIFVASLAALAWLMLWPESSDTVDTDGPSFSGDNRGGSVAYRDINYYAAPPAEAVTPSRKVKQKPVLTPNVKLTELVDIAEGNLMPGSNDRDLNLAILDWLVHCKATMWGRNGETALQPLSSWELMRATLDHKAGTLRVPGDWGYITYTDLRFNRGEIDKFWL